MTTFTIKITKAKANLDVVWEDLPDPVKLRIIEEGLGKMLNGATAKETSSTTPDEAVRAANAMALAEKKLASLKSGQLKTKASRDGKVAGVVMTEARRLAKNIIKAQIKAAGKKISDYEAKAITEAANKYLEKHPELIEAATASVNAAKNLASAVSEEVAGLEASPTKVAANEKKKAEARAATAAKNAGKPGPQASTIKKQAKAAPKSVARRPAPAAEMQAGA